MNLTTSLLKTSKPNNSQNLKTSKPNNLPMTTLRITRKQTNKTTSQGVLTIDGTTLRLETLEAAVRKSGKQIGAALPFGTYRCTVSTELISYKDKLLRVPWITLERVPWFPAAQICDKGLPQAGRIIIGESVGLFEAHNSEEALRLLSETLGECMGDEPSAPAELIIEKADDFTFCDFSHADIIRQQQRDEELARRKQERSGWDGV